MMKKYLYIITSFLLLSGIAYAYYGGSSGVMTDTNCNQAQYFNIGVLCQDADDGKLYKGTGSAIEQIQAYDADLDTWSDITPSTDVQTMLGSANATAIRSNIGLGTIATQNSDNVTITGGNVTGLTTFSAATANVDHIGEKTSSHGVVVDNNITVSGAVTADTMSANVIKTDTSADATLSGTPIIITVYDAASNTPYYFKAYPTKQ